MPGYVFLTQGDLTRIRCDYIVYTTDGRGRKGDLAHAFEGIRADFTSSVKSWVDGLKPRAAVGDAKTLTELPGGRKVIGVVSTRDFKTTDTASAEAAVRAAINCVPEGEPRRVIAFPAVNFGKGGNREARLKSAMAQLQAASNALETRSDLDAVFVTYDPSSYRIFQQARASLSINKVEPGIPQPPAALIDRLRRGQCVTFVGAGVSMESGLPSWQQLIEYLEAQAGIEPVAPSKDVDLMARAQALRDSGKGHEVDGWVRSKVSGPIDGAHELLPSALHYTLASLPVRFYFTTNYDGLLESTLKSARRFPVKVVGRPEVAGTGDSGGTYVVKLHGDAAEPIAAQSDPGLVLSLHDYQQFEANRGSMAALLRSLLLNQSFLFVGYGLRDPNIKALYGEVQKLLLGAKPMAYAVTFGDPPNSSEFPGLETINVADSREVRIFFDRLADAANRRPPLFLARDAHKPRDGSTSDVPRLGKLAKRLHESGMELQRSICDGKPLNETESRLALGVAAFLVDHGWRPKGCTIKSLADRACGKTTPAELRREWFRFVLPYCRDASEVRAVWTELEKADSGSPAIDPP